VRRSRKHYWKLAGWFLLLIVEKRDYMWHIRCYVSNNGSRFLLSEHLACLPNQNGEETSSLSFSSFLTICKMWQCCSIEEHSRACQREQTAKISQKYCRPRYGYSLDCRA
jgi:hypothetical protein